MSATRWPLLRDLAVLFILGLAATSLVERWGGADVGLERRSLEASLQMQEAIEAIAQHRERHGPPIDPASDINGTGLLGAFFSPMTTTIGNLEAKRTSTNPDMAGLVVWLLLQAGVRPGDFIAVGGSGSFPGLMVATLCAALAMDLEVGLVTSLGASQWGANLLDFTWLSIEQTLCERGILTYRTSAASIGGDLDVGRDLTAEVRAALRQQIESSGAVLIEESDLETNVQQRMAVFRAQAAGRPIRAFVNVGGGWANLGLDASVLGLSPGVNRTVTLPAISSRGVIHAMVEAGVPIVHLLNLKDLALRAGLPWDPSPLPTPGTLRLRGDGLPAAAMAVATGYLAIIAVWGVRRARRRRSAWSLVEPFNDEG